MQHHGGPDAPEAAADDSDRASPSPCTVAVSVESVIYAHAMNTNRLAASHDLHILKRRCGYPERAVLTGMRTTGPS